ncbi:TniQ family protein [Pararhodobacter sp. CCB-MM2]|uniref:TniQ family protein n=1 Tax=Pararhodobacter sp. CCB-MM2 TaxID=1786003 RepID=UPI000831C32B|nr:TniQ family protein [Pararhodobacter sp. CCB-MM2]
MTGYLANRLGWVPRIAPDELLTSWVWRIEAYFEVPGLLCASLGCQPSELDHHPPSQALRQLSLLTGLPLVDLEGRCGSRQSVFDDAVPTVCPACLEEMAGGPQGLYLRCAWAHGLRTICPLHLRPLVALPISGAGLFLWRGQGGCDFAHRVNQLLVEESRSSQPNATDWEELARFEAALAGGQSCAAAIFQT